MAEGKRKDAQEVQEDTYTSEEIQAALERNGMTPERIHAAMDKLMPEEYQQKLIHAAAIASGRDEKDLPIEEALVLLQVNPPAREAKKIIDSVSEQASEAFLKSVSDEQLKGVAADLITGRLVPEIMDALEKVQPPRKIEIIKGREAPAIQAVQKALGDVSSAIGELTQGMAPVFKTALDAIGEQLRQVSEVWDAVRDQIPPDVLERLKGWWDEAEPLLPFIAAELKARDIDCGAMTFLEEQVETDGAPKTELAAEILQAARERRDGLHRAQEEVAEALPVIAAAAVTELDYPLDKVNNKLWNQFKNADPNGQLFYDFDFVTSKRGNKSEAGVYLSINFDALDKLPGLQITRGLTAFDKRLYMAAAAAGAAGNGYTSLGRLHEAMGNTGKPSSGQLERIEQSLQKMGKAWITIQNPDEVAAKMKYPQFEYNGPLLPFEQVRALVNGQVTESAVHFFREPPLVTFARERKQITTVSRRLLESPVSKTEDNLRIDDYLIDRIAQMKNNKKNPRKILLETLYTECAIKGKQKQRAPEKIKKYLDHYQKEKFIQGYSMDNEKITFAL